MTEFQAERTVLEAQLRATPASESLKRKEIEWKLTTHRLQSQQKSNLYDALGKEARALALTIDTHNKAVDQLVKENQATS